MPSDSELLDELTAFAAKVSATCPHGIDPHHFGSRLGAIQYLGIARRIVAVAAGGLVLDWGTGFGQVAHLVARLGGRVEAFDINRDFLEVSTELLDHPAIPTAVTDPAEPLPYPTGRFRVVASVGTLEHTTDESSALREVHRVLDKQGHFLIFHLPNHFSYIERLAALAGRFAHDRTYSRRQAEKLLNRHGFMATSIRPYHLLPRSSFSRNRLLTSLSDRFYRRIDWLDNRLGALFPLSLVATAFSIEARRLPRAHGKPTSPPSRCGLPPAS